VEPFAEDALERVESKPGAASFMVGMPNFPAIYGIRAALEYIRGVRVEEIEARAAPLVEQCLAGLRQLPLELITPTDPDSLAGILAFRHPEMERLHQALEAQRIQVMHSAGRLRVALHAYNTPGDVEHLLTVLSTALS
jgi:cysteine desulfurase/selenocysteine lyase